MSRRCPGPSPTTTDAAPARRKATAAPMTTSGWVLMAVPASYSTMFGLRNTRRPRTSTPSSRQPASDQRREVDVVGARRQQRHRGAIERPGTRAGRTGARRQAAAAHSGTARRRGTPAGRADPRPPAVQSGSAIGGLRAAAHTAPSPHPSCCAEIDRASAACAASRARGSPAARPCGLERECRQRQRDGGGLGRGGARPGSRGSSSPRRDRASAAPAAQSPVVGTYGPQLLAEHVRVAVVPAALLAAPIDEQRFRFGEPRAASTALAAPPLASQREQRPGRRLDPAEGPGNPRPALQLVVLAVDRLPTVDAAAIPLRALERRRQLRVAALRARPARAVKRQQREGVKREVRRRRPGRSRSRPPVGRPARQQIGVGARAPAAPSRSARAGSPCPDNSPSRRRRCGRPAGTAGAPGAGLRISHVCRLPMRNDASRSVRGPGRTPPPILCGLMRAAAAVSQTLPPDAGSGC